VTTRVSGRAADDLRLLTFTRDFTEMATGSVLVEFGRTRVLCTASLETRVPPWLKNSGKGWVTASICGGWIALHDACSRLLTAGVLTRHPVSQPCAAISVGVIDGTPMLDLEYSEDVRAEVDMNVVMTGDGRFVEVQGTAEGVAFTRAELDALLGLAEAGIKEIVAAQLEMVAEAPALRP